MLKGNTPEIKSPHDCVPRQRGSRSSLPRDLPGLARRLDHGCVITKQLKEVDQLKHLNITEAVAGNAGIT